MDGIRVKWLNRAKGLALSVPLGLSFALGVAGMLTLRSGRLAFDLPLLGAAWGLVSILIGGYRLFSPRRPAVGVRRRAQFRSR